MGARGQSVSGSINSTNILLQVNCYVAFKSRWFVSLPRRGQTNVSTRNHGRNVSNFAQKSHSGDQMYESVARTRAISKLKVLL